MSEEKKNGFKRFVIVVAVITLGVIVVFPGSNLIQGFKAGREIRQDRKQLKELQKQTAEMEEQIRQLKSNPDTLEKFAREQFQFAAPGDDVYILGD